MEIEVTPKLSLCMNVAFFQKWNSLWEWHHDSMVYYSATLGRIHSQNEENPLAFLCPASSFWSFSKMGELCRKEKRIGGLMVSNLLPVWNIILTSEERMCKWFFSISCFCIMYVTLVKSRCRMHLHILHKQTPIFECYTRQAKSENSIHLPVSELR